MTQMGADDADGVGDIIGMLFCYEVQGGVYEDADSAD